MIFFVVRIMDKSASSKREWPDPRVKPAPASLPRGGPRPFLPRRQRRAGARTGGLLDYRWAVQILVIRKNPKLIHRTPDIVGVLLNVSVEERKKLYSFNEKTKHQDDVSHKKEPESVRGDEWDGHNYTEKTNGGNYYRNPKSTLFRRC